MGLNESFHKLDEAVKDRDQKHSEFIRNILVIASGALSILATLHTAQSKTQISRISFDVAMVSLSFGILTGALTLYRHVNVSKQIYDGLRKAIIKQLKSNANQHEIVTGKPSAIFELAEGLCYFSLGVAVISLCLYVISVN